MTETIAGSLLCPSLGKRRRAEEERPGETGPTVDPVAVSALPRRVGRSVGSTPRFSRDCWPQGQPHSTSYSENVSKTPRRKITPRRARSTETPAGENQPAEGSIRDLIITENITLDGSPRRPRAGRPAGGEDAISHIETVLRQQRKAADALLLGRVTFEQMCGYWPLQTDDTTGTHPVVLGRGQQLFANASAVPRPKTVSTARRCATCARTQDGVP